MSGPRARAVALLAGVLCACQANPLAGLLPVLPLPVAQPEIVPELDAPACLGEPEVTHSVYLVGDAGAPELARPGRTRLADPVLRQLNGDVVASVGALGVQGVAVVFLGDNVYPVGLPPAGDGGREHAERVLRTLIASSEPARAIFVAGNHDWGIAGAEGFDRVWEQRSFLESQGERVVMLPPGGCAGPSRLDLGEHLRLVMLDQVGWFHAATYPEVHRAACPHTDATEVFFALAAEFDRPEDRHVVLLAHHPLISAGPHGGAFGLREHVFPLTDFWSWAWLPLPLLGSIYAGARRAGVTRTDLSSEPYRHYVSAIYRASRPGVPLLIAGGHEHSLQFYRDPVGTYHAVSGAGSVEKVNRVSAGEGALFAAARPGYMRLDAHADGSLGLSVLALAADGEREPVYRHCLVEGPAPPRRY